MPKGVNPSTTLPSSSHSFSVLYQAKHRKHLFLLCLGDPWTKSSEATKIQAIGVGEVRVGEIAGAWRSRAGQWRSRSTQGEEEQLEEVKLQKSQKIINTNTYPDQELKWGKTPKHNLGTLSLISNYHIAQENQVKIKQVVWGILSSFCYYQSPLTSQLHLNEPILIS